jgi:hypothetical protein
VTVDRQPAHGDRTTTCEVVISDEAGRRVCTSRLTCLLMDRVPGKGGHGARWLWDAAEASGGRCGPG